MPDKKTKAETISKKLLFFHRQYVKTFECMQMNAYAKSFHENSKYMNFLVKDEKTFKKKNEIWNKIGSLFFN